jgi:N utilization substance protein B
MLDPADTPEKDVMVYSRHLCSLIIQHLDEMDRLIKKYSKNWDFERITIMDRLILRMSLAEMLFEDEVPPKVSIAEGVEIAKQFSTSDSSSFINGIMDAVYNDLVKGKEKAA